MAAQHDTKYVTARNLRGDGGHLSRDVHGGESSKVEEFYPTQLVVTQEFIYAVNQCENIIQLIKIMIRTFTGSRYEWCIILDYDKTNPKDEQKMTLSRLGGAPDHQKPPSPRAKKSRRPDEVKIEIVVPPDLYRKHLVRSKTQVFS